MRKGRKARLAAPPVASAVKAGMKGGSYQPLSDSDMAQMNDVVLNVLEKIGMADPIPIVREHALKRGCFINEHEHLWWRRGGAGRSLAVSWPGGLRTY